MNDSTIATMIQRHRDLYRLTDALYAAGGDAATDTADYKAASYEMTELEYRIAATRASSAEVGAKRRFLSETGFIGDDYGNPPTGDLVRLVETILQLDTESSGRLSSSRPDICDARDRV